jgi:exosortase A-associated hydrolase 1/exosortase A-associated hydrolase 2
LIRPFYLEGSRGPLLAIHYPPLATRHPLGDILLIPPFAEEMNRCRAMVSMQARSFSQRGIGTLILDPFGTGDSGGEFSEGSWDQWRDDLQRGIEWLRRNSSGCQTLWGIRLGAIMASEIAAQDPGIDRLLFWQPVVQGKNHFTQFLRIRIAAEMGQSDGIKTTEQLRKLSTANETIEVSGYQIGPALARSLDGVRLPDAANLSAKRLAWFELVTADDVPISPANAKVLDAYRSDGIDVAFETVIGPSFWQVHERAVAPDLIEATTREVGAWPGTARSVPEPAPALQPTTSPQDGSSPEIPLSFTCEGTELMSILHRGHSGARRGFVIVVAGGPQYRAGAHRQFVSLARKLAARGHPVLRFDLRGMGDSDGTYRGYEHSHSDIRAAIDALVAAQPQLAEVVLFGECESASGILFYAYDDSRVKGIVLVNPWVRTEEGRAQAIIKHYYLERLLSRNFWRKVASGSFSPRESLTSFFQLFGSYVRGRRIAANTSPDSGHEDISAMPLPVKTAAGLRRFRGPVMILLSGRDWIAKEFEEVVGSSKAWQGLLDNPRICRRVMVDADHTFSRQALKDEVSERLFEWLDGW